MNFTCEYDETERMSESSQNNDTNEFIDYNEYTDSNEYTDFNENRENSYNYELLNNKNEKEKSSEYKKVYKNTILNELNNSAIFDAEKLIDLIKKYAKDYNDYIFIKKVFNSDKLNKSVTKYIEYSEFIENISELFDDDENKKNKILKLSKKTKKIIKKEIQFNFNFTHPSSELIKFVHQKSEKNNSEDLDIFFKFIDIKKSSREGFLIYKKAIKILKTLNHGLEIIKKKYLSDEQIMDIMKQLCQNENLKYNKNSLLKSVSTIKNYSQETFEDE